MIIYKETKIERSFSGDVLFDNINIQVDERDHVPWLAVTVLENQLTVILVGEEAPTISKSIQT